jgi:glycine hydroxymethyltransferase
MTPEFAAYQRQVLANATTLAASLADAGYRIVSGGTDTHVLLADVFAKGIRGKEAQTALEQAHITANRNAIPFDQNPPFNPSGMRFGSPAVTTRGFREAEMRQTAELIARVLDHSRDEALLAGVLLDVRREVAKLTERFPLYPWRLAPAAVG